jgi:hypothetical protein
LDLPPRQIPPTPTPLAAAAVPTIPPAAAPSDLATPPAAADPPPAAPSPLRGVCGLGLIPALLLLGGVARRRGGDA